VPVPKSRYRDSKTLTQQLRRRPVIFESSNRFTALSRCLELTAKLADNCFRKLAPLRALVARCVEVKSDLLMGVASFLQPHDRLLDRVRRFELLQLADSTNDLVLAFVAAGPANGNSNSLMVSFNPSNSRSLWSWGQIHVPQAAGQATRGSCRSR